MADKEWFYERENGFSQDILIKFGLENADFTLAMLGLLQTLSTAEDLETTTVPVVFHGTEDITAELGRGFLAEYLLFSKAFSAANGGDYLSKANDTPLKVTDSH